MIIAYGEELETNLGCEHDNVNHTCLFKGLFLGEYFLKYFIILKYYYVKVYVSVFKYV